MKKILMGLAVMSLFISETVSAHQVLRLNPLYYGDSFTASYEFAIGNKTSIYLGYSSMKFSDAGGTTHFNLSSLSMKRTFTGSIEEGWYWRLGMAKIDTNIFDSVPLFGSLFSDLASGYIPYFIVGLDIKMGNAWLMSWELGTDIAFISIGYVF